jgi:hypothetical protein
MVTQSHPPLIRGLAENHQPLIIERADDDFVEGTLATLQKGVNALLPFRAQDRAPSTAAAATRIKLYQPVHRTFHLAFFEVACDTLMTPRLDPRRIVEAGMVVRRIEKGGRMLAWGDFADGSKGWIERSGSQLALPAPAETEQRPIRTGNKAVDGAIVRAAPPSPLTFTERVTQLFPVPTETMEQTERTIFFGMVPTTSNEQSVKPSPFSDPAFLRDHIPTYFRAATGTRLVSKANQMISLATFTAANAAPTSGDNRLFLDFIGVVRQLTYEFAAFDREGKFPLGAELFQRLNAIQLTFTIGVDRTFKRPAGEFLQELSDLILLKTRTASVQMPRDWSLVTSAQAEAIADTIRRIVEARLAFVRPQEGRFENPNWTYVVQGYVVVKEEDGCGTQTAWSRPSQPFAIAPWYDGKQSPVPISLPTMAELKNIKPGVAFAVPPELAGLLDGSDPKDLLEGKGRPIQMAVMWICSFNIPAITLCAFIVLNIFFSLFDLIFQWMLFIKLCIPIPIPKEE